MALSKIITQKNGVSTTYHKVTDISLRDISGDDYSENEKILAPLKLTVGVTSFLDAEYRKSGYSINSEIYTFDLTSEEEESLSIRKLAYSKLKTLEVFANAEDC